MKPIFYACLRHQIHFLRRAAWGLLGLVLCVGWQPSEPKWYRMDFVQFRTCSEPQTYIDPTQPNYELLDAAIFHATNQARTTYGYPAFRYAAGLHHAAASHATEMIRLDFYSHENPYSPINAKLSQRVEQATWDFLNKAENIGQYQLIDTAPIFGVRRTKVGFEYFDCDNTKRVFKPYTYWQMAEYAVSQWMNSPAHRHNLLDSALTDMGCAARLSRLPFQQRTPPFGRFVQNFGRSKH